MLAISKALISAKQPRHQSPLRSAPSMATSTESVSKTQPGWLGLSGKTAIVTGGGSGLGRAITTELARAGVGVAILDSRVDENWDIVKAISSTLEVKVPLVYLQADIRDTAMFTAAITRAAKELGGAPDILVNNAGINLPARLVDLQGRAEVTKEAMDAIFGVNVYGTVLTSQTFARFLLKAGKPGVILNISSESGEHGSIGQGIYSASKASIDCLTKTWAKEMGASGIRVVSVAPGILETTGLRTPQYEAALAYSRGISVEQLRSGYMSSIPVGREARLGEVANVVAFLASPRSSYVTGAGVQVTGGKS